MRKYFDSILETVSGRGVFLVRSQDGLEKNLTLNQIIILTIDRRPMTEESEVTTISIEPEEAVDLDKLYSNVVYVF